MIKDWELAKQVLEKVATSIYRTPLSSMIKQWGEQNEEPEDGLGCFAGKIYVNLASKDSTPDEVLKPLEQIYHLHMYGISPDYAVLKKFLEGDRYENNSAIN